MLWIKTFDGPHDAKRSWVVEFSLSFVNLIVHDTETGYIRELRSNNLVLREVINASEQIKLIDFQAKTLKELEIKLALAGFIHDDSKDDADNRKWNLDNSHKGD